MPSATRTKRATRPTATITTEPQRPASCWRRRSTSRRRGAAGRSTAASSTIGRPHRLVTDQLQQSGEEAAQPGPEAAGRARAVRRPPGSGRVLRASGRTRCRWPWRMARKMQQLCRCAWPRPTPTAIGSGPATAVTWEAMTYASAAGRSARWRRCTPNPTEVSSAIEFRPAELHARTVAPKGASDAGPDDQPGGRLYLTSAARWLQPGDLGIEERRSAVPPDDDRPITRDSGVITTVDVAPAVELQPADRSIRRVCVERRQAVRRPARRGRGPGGCRTVAAARSPADRRAAWPSATGTRPGTPRRGSRPPAAGSAVIRSSASRSDCSPPPSG